MINDKIDNIKPIILCGSFKRGNYFLFNTPIGQISVKNVNNLVETFLKHANGLNTLDTISRISDRNKRNLYKAFLVLKKHKIAEDSRYVYRWFHDLTLSESPYKQHISLEFINSLKPLNRLGEHKNLHKLSNLEKLLVLRKTTRNFSGRPIPLNQILRFLKGIYILNSHKTIPSGGALYPLSLYVVIINSDIASGIYFYDSFNEKLKSISPINELDSLYFAISNQTMVDCCSFITFICCNLENQPHKYANRGYRYSILESGHAAQNAHLLSIENGWGICEYGAFNDSEVKKLLNLTREMYPIISLIIGHKLSKNIPTIPSVFSRVHSLIEKYSDSGKKIIKSYSVERLIYKDQPLNKYCAVSNYEVNRSNTLGKPRKGRGFGVGYSKEEAVMKSLVEALERFFSGEIRVDKISKIPLTKGYSLLNGKSEYVPTETVYYPLSEKELGYIPSVKANSSGIAAHFIKSEAIKNALYELIERDAIAIVWFGKKEVRRLHKKLLPEHILQRIKFWKKLGRSVSFVDFTTDSIPVIVCFFVSKNYPAIVSGAKAHDNLCVAIEKSFEEAEYAMLAWERQKDRIINKKDISTPLDHGLYYASGKHTKDLDFIIKTRYTGKIKVKKFDVATLIRKFEPVIVELHQAETKNDVWVVKAISNKLIPLTFGYGKEKRNDTRLKLLNLKWARSYPSKPHFFP